MFVLSDRSAITSATLLPHFHPPSTAPGALPPLGSVAPHARLLIHGEQSFTWPEPWRIGSMLTATGVVDRVRERGGVSFATFLMDVHDEAGRHVLGAKSVFLMSKDTPPGGEAPERAEPALPDGALAPEHRLRRTAGDHGGHRADPRARGRR